MYGGETQRRAARFVIAGTEEDCRERLAALAAAGVDHLVGSPVASEDELDDQLGHLALLIPRGSDEIDT
jgi:alkanesulfonate monooxygenase SsuD/methylene tetrahydromethanopterin reductase-like flavin-dependent oxidoreductase (luciferase family)